MAASGNLGRNRRQSWPGIFPMNRPTPPPPAPPPPPLWMQNSGSPSRGVTKLSALVDRSSSTDEDFFLYLFFFVGKHREKTLVENLRRSDGGGGGGGGSSIESFFVVERLPNRKVDDRGPPDFWFCRPTCASTLTEREREREREKGPVSDAQTRSPQLNKSPPCQHTFPSFFLFLFFTILTSFKTKKTRYPSLCWSRPRSNPSTTRRKKIAPGLQWSKKKE